MPEILLFMNYRLSDANA